MTNPDITPESGRPMFSAELSAALVQAQVDVEIATRRVAYLRRDLTNALLDEAGIEVGRSLVRTLNHSPDSRWLVIGADVTAGRLGLDLVRTDVEPEDPRRPLSTEPVIGAQIYTIEWELISE